MKNNIKLMVFLVARLLGLFVLARKLTAHKVRILCYHGGCLGDENRYNPKLFCSSAMLAARMKWLRSSGFDIVTLDEAASRVRTPPDNRPALTTAITFDDGWYSTASELVPVLGEMQIPSTLYLCTSHYLEGAAVPSVAVRYMLWKSTLASFELTGFGPGTDGHFDISSEAGRDDAANKIVSTIVRSATSRASVHAMLEQVAQCLAVPSSTLALESRRFEYLNQAELLALPGQGCTIELHGHVHRYPAGQVDVFKQDLQMCSDVIMAAGLPKPRHYCYPSGNFDAAASPALSSMDVASATTCLPGLVSQADATQSHFLPRFLDGEHISMLEFQAEMSGFYDIARRLIGKPHPLQPV